MPVENTNTILGLNVNFPAGGEGVGESDNHHRQNKEVLKNIFQGPTGNGFSVPITCSETEINYLTGVTSLIQTQLNALVAVDATKIARDGSQNFTGSTGCDVNRTADDEYCRSDDFAEATIGGTIKARFDGGTNTLYLSNTAVDP